MPCAAGGPVAPSAGRSGSRWSGLVHSGFALAIAIAIRPNFPLRVLSARYPGCRSRPPDTAPIATLAAAAEFAAHRADGPEVLAPGPVKVEGESSSGRAESMGKTRMTPDDTGTAAPARTRIEYLEELGDELVRRGLRVRLTLPRGQSPSLHVMNPDASALTENILAERGADGWWYWWSWAERIAPADDVAVAADRVALVLAVL
ncbi:hypothetical protein GCM10009727_32440 [Actinomadura napierensis]|uniref:Uncharacterized protein n=2 Tax=Actinomadura napierensis TaxID=267854 RepID=A0ABN2Z5Q2_9ACTN